MINNTKQNWTVGKSVNVGFMTLIVKAAVKTEGDYLPDAYILTNQAGTQLYKFVPHNGCQKIDIEEAKSLLATGEQSAAYETAIALDNARKAVEIQKVFA